MHLLDYSPCTNSGSGDANTIGLGSTEGYGTNPDTTHGDTGIVDMGYHFTGYTSGVPCPAAPATFNGAASSTSEIQWTWSDVADELGYAVHDDYHNLKVLATADATTTKEVGLAANTRYSRHVHAYNDGGESLPSTTDAKYTWALPPNVTSNKVGTTFTFTSVPAFGAGGVKYYQYTWTQSATETWGGGGTTWSSGLLTLEAPTDGWYLHLKSYNGADIANPTTLDSGPYGPFNNYWYVDAGVAGPGTGTPLDPFKTINSAEAKASSGEAIFVRMGLYHLTSTITLDSGTYLRGGFDGNWSPTGDATTTTISGDAIVRCMRGTGLSTATTIECLTIRNGSAESGGGLSLESSSPTINNCIFTFNRASSASYGGGGMYCHFSTPEILGCAFTFNSANNWLGGGIFNNFSSPTISNCTFESNSAYFGGGIGNTQSYPIISNCTFKSNSAPQGGGGIYNSYSSPEISNCTFTSNNANNWCGGGMFNSYSSPTISNCAFTSNSAMNGSGNGGGICNWPNSSPIILSCTFTLNKAWGNTGGIYNCTSSCPKIKNSIIYNQISGGSMYSADGLSTPEVSYSCIQGGWTGTGNISADALFVNAAGGDVHLLDYSPCTNSGSGDAHILGLSSLEGYGTNTDATKGDTGIVDMGYHYSGYTGGIAYPDVPATFIGTANSTSEIQWTWSDVADEIGYAVHDYDHNLKVLATANVTTTKEGGLTANTLCVRHVHAYNDGGESLPSATDAKYTWAVPPNVTSSKVGTTFTFTSVPTFGAVGPGGVQYYQWTWTQSATETWGGGSTTWSSGLLTLEAPTDGWYLHVKSFNGDGIANPTTLDSGPYGPFNNYWYVDAGVAGPGTGTPSDPFKTINSAEAKASSGEAIYVRMGVYHLTQTITLDSGTYLRGGFDGNWSSTGDATTTIISGDAIVQCMYGKNLSSATTVEGFTIKNGFIAGSGGGLYLISSSASIINCTFTSNKASGNGNGIYILYSSPQISGCAFTNNTNNGYGGGIYNVQTSPLILNCLFASNNVYQGGGIYNDKASPIISSCTFTSNIGSNSGGAIFNSYSSPEVMNCIFTSNSAAAGGGICDMSISCPVIINCVFTSNSSTGYYGGGIYNNGSCSPVISNCAFALNSAVNGGAIYDEGNSSPSISNCTLTSNSATSYGGGIYNFGSCSPVITNSIICKNSCAALNAGNIYNISSSNPIVTYSCVQPLIAATGNISGEPQFVNGPAGNVHLLDYSPCTNSGTGDAHLLGLGSLEGYGTNPDTTHGDTGIVDMGYHYTGYSSGVPCPAAPATFSGTASSTSEIQWTWSDVAGEIGYSVHDDYHNLKVLEAADATTTKEAGLTANTLCSRHVHAYNDGGESLPSNTDAKYTWALPPSVTYNKVGTSFTFTSVPTFGAVGPGGVQYYQWTWTQSATETWGGGSTTWSSGLLTLEAPTDGWYLHLKSYNGDNIANPTTLDSGPYGPFNNYWYVDAGVAGPGTGTPSDPFKTINSAEAKASSGEAIYVRMGVYRLTATITLDSGTYLKGGFDGNWSSTGDASTTIISGDAIVQCLYGTGLSSATTIEGFTIKKGYTTGNGGGLSLESSSPTITNCAFSFNNASGQGGGAMYCHNSTPEVLNCTFTSNTSANYGGAIYNNYASPTFLSCAFGSNSTTTFGGGAIWNGYASPAISNCTFNSNTANNASTGRGGGIGNNNSSSPTISNCTFTSNSAGAGGGAVFNTVSSTPNISNCTFESNSTTSYGGGIYNNGVSPTISGCTFHSNKSNTGYGGGIYDASASPNISNCGFTTNSSINGYGGGIFNHTSSPENLWLHLYFM